MDDAVPMVRVPIASSHMQDVLSRLTAYLLQEQHAFLQTFYDEQHTEFEIFQHSGQAVVRLTLSADAAASPAGLPTASTLAPTQTGETALLIQRLLAVCNPG